MTAKPLNLSILIGDMNRNSPPVSPRISANNNNNKKSRIPLATSQTLTGSNPQILTKGVTTFRQWADPPPPPIRSRTFERKTIPQKRPGSADPRFRRTVGPTKTSNNRHMEGIPLISKSSSVTNLTSFNDKDNEEDFESFAADDIEYCRNKSYLEENNDDDVSDENIILDRTERLNSKYEDSLKQLRVMESNLMLDSPDPANKEIIIREIYTNNTPTESKYSQTDVYSNIYSDIQDIPEQSLSNDMIEDNNDIINYITSSYEKTARYIDDLVLNRTRSISTIYELEPSREIRHPRLLKSISKIILSHNYWMYLEMGAALLFFLALLMFGWYYLLPYLTDAFFTWIYPRPSLTVQDYFKRSINDMLSSTGQSIYNLLTAPANRR